MAKKIVDFDKALGGDGAQVVGALSVVGETLEAKIAVTYPLEKVLTPAYEVIDKLIDKVEKLIPGDQSALAAGLKEDARRELLQLLSEKKEEA